MTTTNTAPRFSGHVQYIPATLDPEVAGLMRRTDGLTITPEVTAEDDPPYQVLDSNLIAVDFGRPKGLAR